MTAFDRAREIMGVIFALLAQQRDETEAWLRIARKSEELGRLARACADRVAAKENAKGIEEVLAAIDEIESKLKGGRQ